MHLEEEGKSSWISVLGVFLGFLIVVGVMSVGGGLAAQMNFENFLWAVIIGNIILAIFAAIAGYTGAVSNKSFKEMLVDAFPDWSARIASLYVPLVLIGWYAIEASIFGSFISQTFGIGAAGEKIIIILGAVIFSASAYYGFKALRYVSTILVPVLLAVGAYAIWTASQTNTAAFAFGDATIGFSGAVALVVGTWAMGSLTVVPDLTRFVKTGSAGIAVGALGILIGNIFNLLVGGAGAALTGNSDPGVVLSSLGLLAAGLLFGVANIWTTQDNNMYSASLHLSKTLSIKRKTAVIIAVIIGAIAALFQPHRISVLFTYLGFLGDTAPALGAVVLGRYWLADQALLKDHSSLPAWGGWIGGSAIGIWLGGAISYLVGFIAGFLLFWMATKIEG